MQFRFEIAEKGEKKKNRQTHYRRMLCFFMMVVLLCSGCGSIILSGNLEFSANAPIQPLPASQTEKKIEQMTFGAVQTEKYGVDGKDAFVVLPGHLCPADIPKLNEKVQEYNDNDKHPDKKSMYRADFKVLDYNNNIGRFVYAYYTPYIRYDKEQKDEEGNMVMAPKATMDSRFIELGNTGMAKTMDVLKVDTLNAAMNAKADGFTPEHVTSEEDLDGGVLVLMSYDPENKDYTVFLSTTYSASENAANDNRCIVGMAGLDAGIDEGEANSAGGLIDKEEALSDSNQKNYYVYAHDHLYLFKEDGTLIYSSNYKSVVESKAKEMAETYGHYEYSRYTVSNVEIDGKGIPYFTLDMEVSHSDFSKADVEANNIINNDKDYEEKDDTGEGDAAEDVGGVTYFHGTFACLRANIGGSNGMGFMSELTDTALTNLQKDEYCVSENVVEYTKARETKEVEVTQTVTRPVTQASSGGNATGNNTEGQSESDEETAAEGQTESVEETATEGQTESVEETVTVQQTETLEETMSRLKSQLEAEDAANAWNKTDAAKSQRDAYLVSAEFVNEMNTGFSDFTAGSGDVIYHLCGGSNGRNVVMQNKDGSTAGTWEYHTNNYSYEHYYFLWFSHTVYVRYGRRFLQSELIGGLAGYLNRGFYLPALKPGAYGGKDWAYYDIANYAERNGEYRYNTDQWLKGHAQPLVSSRYFESRYSDSTNRLVADNNGALWYAYANAAEPSGFTKWYIATQMSGSRYYYNNTLDSKFSIPWDDNTVITSGFPVTDSDGSSWYQTYNINSMLRDNLPYVMVYREYKGADGSTQRTYMPISNDDNCLYILPVMTLEKTQEITLYKKYYLKDEKGNKHLYYTREQKVTVPAQYKMEFPANCFVQEMGDTWVGNRVKAADEELEALTYFTVKGQRLAEDSLWDWGQRDSFPIYDNASDEHMETKTRYTWWWGWYYKNNNFWNFYNGADSDKYFTTVETKRDGKDGLIYDRMVPGEVQDLGVWKLGDEKIIAVFTDQVIRFYKKETGTKKPKFGKYRAVAEVRIDELRSLASAYMLKELGDNSSLQGSYGTHSLENRAMDALNSDEGMYQLDAKNILPVKNDLSKFLYFSADGGLHLLYLVKPPLSGSDIKDWHRQGRVMNLLQGTYYNVFSDTGDNYKVVGFQTQKFSYTGADLCMAKMYDLDLNTMVANKSSNAVQDYMTSLRNAYLTGTHTISISVNEAGGVVGKVVTPGSNDVDFQRGKVLLTGEGQSDYNAAYNLLVSICKEYGMSAPSPADVDYLKELRETYRTQRSALKEMYTFLGIDSTKLADNWIYVQYEGRVFNAAYESILEETMIEIVLSDNYLNEDITPRLNGIAGMVGVHAYDATRDGPADQLKFTDVTGQYVDELANYRALYKKWVLDNKVTSLAVTALSDKDLEDKIDALTEEMKQRNATLAPGQAKETMSEQMKNENTSAISGMDFYKEVSDILEERYIKTLDSQ